MPLFCLGSFSVFTVCYLLIRDLTNMWASVCSVRIIIVCGCHEVISSCSLLFFLCTKHIWRLVKYTDRHISFHRNSNIDGAYRMRQGRNNCLAHRSVCNRISISLHCHCRSMPRHKKKVKLAASAISLQQSKLVIVLSNKNCNRKIAVWIRYFDNARNAF